MARAKKKRPSPAEAYRAIRHSRLVDALTIGEQYRAVKSIRMRATFTDADGTALKTTWNRTRTAADKASFEEDCPAEKCERGGFDFGSVARKVISAHDTSTTGTLMCKGRRGKWVCRISAHYTIDVAYA